MDAASLIPIPLRMTLSEPSRPWPEQETIWRQREMLVTHSSIHAFNVYPHLHHPRTPPPIILTHLQPSSSHTSTHHPHTPPPIILTSHTIVYTHLPLTLYTTTPYSLTPSSPHPTHQVLSLFVQVHYAHVHDGADVCEALHDLHVATTLISCCAQLQKYKNKIKSHHDDATILHNNDI